MNARVADLHLWRLGPGHRGLIVSLVSPDQITADAYPRGLARSAMRSQPCHGRSGVLRRLCALGCVSQKMKSGTDEACAEQDRR